MCTVTIVPMPGDPPGDKVTNWRMACSRDERHGRAPALVPQVREAPSGMAYVMPIDPSSSGTWVAVNAAGLGLTLLNYNPTDPPTNRNTSRGGVIPMLAGCDGLDEAVAACAEVSRERMMPFRLVLCDGKQVAAWRSTEAISSIQVEPLGDRPRFFTSSGLGDYLVEGPRRKVFEGWFGDSTGVDGQSLGEQQDALHRHRWPDRPELSICMSRPDARTVSYTVVEAGPQSVTMAYHPDRPDIDAADSVVTLKRRVCR